MNIYSLCFFKQKPNIYKPKHGKRGYTGPIGPKVCLLVLLYIQILPLENNIQA